LAAGPNQELSPNGLCRRDDYSRAQEFDDLELEFALRGLETLARRVLPEVTGLDERFRKEHRKLTPRPPPHMNASMTNWTPSATC
jgi:hypothetical protein